MNDLYYCFPDIHGMSNLLKKALDFVYTKNPSGGKIIFLGDYIDRGPDNKGVLEIAMNTPAHWEFVTLLGNHEKMFIDSYTNRQQFFDPKVLYEYSKSKLNAVEDFPVDIIQWMYNLKLTHIEENNVFAHGFYDPSLDQNSQKEDSVIWNRYDDFESFDSDTLYLTHGHTPRKNGPIQTKNRTNLDIGSVYYKQFAIAEYQQGVKGPVAFYKFD